MVDQAKAIDALNYERAAAFAPPKFVAELSGQISNGYWLGDHRYFFCVTEADATGTIGNRARLADMAAGTVTTLIEPEALSALISGHAGTQPDAVKLANARYDVVDDTLVVTIGCDAYSISLEGLELIKVETLDQAISLYSPDGKYAAFLKDNAVWLKDRQTGDVRQLSPDGEPYNGYGVSPESSTDPIGGRKHAIPNGLWSADSQWFVTHRIDERHLPEGGLVEHVPGDGKRPVAHLYKLTTPDGDLPTAEFVAFHIPSGRSVSSGELQVPVLVFSPFMMRQCWFTGTSVYFLVWDRFFSSVELVQMPLDGQPVRTVLREASDNGWIDLQPSILGQPIIRVLPRSNEVIWWSESSGYGHLQLHDLASGSIKNLITQGDWMVRDIVHVDEARRRIFFLANGFADDCDPAHRRLCAIDFDGTGFETLFTDGDVAVTADPVSGVEQFRPFRPSYTPTGASPDARYFALQTGAADQATQSSLIDVAKGQRLILATMNVDTLWSAPKPQPFEVLAADGVTKLYGILHLPSDFDPAASYPVVDYIYPGPQINWYVRRFPSFSGVTAQSVAELGMAAIILETRGMPYRNRAFHQAGQGQLHEPQLADHAAAIEQLCKRHPFLDRNRVGMFGASGGGYATARAMFDYPDVFKTGVSMCGNHDARNYIGLWLNKYGGRPGTPARDEQSNIGVAHKLRGKLLMIHGDMDANVHPAHALSLSAALIKAGKEFDQLIIPGAGHALIPNEPYALLRLWHYFARHLIGAEPPADFALSWSPADAAACEPLLRDGL